MNYCEARPLISDGDLVAVRGRGLAAALVRAVTQSPYTHTGVAFWCAGRLLLAETRGINANIVPLSQYADAEFDVFACPVDRALVAAMIWLLLGTDIRYDWCDVARLAAHELFGFPLPARDDGEMLCSALSASIYLHCGWRPFVLPSIPLPRDVVTALDTPLVAVVAHD